MSIEMEAGLIVLGMMLAAALIDIAWGDRLDVLGDKVLDAGDRLCDVIDACVMLVEDRIDAFFDTIVGKE